MLLETLTTTATQQKISHWTRDPFSCRHRSFSDLEQEERQAPVGKNSVIGCERSMCEDLTPTWQISAEPYLLLSHPSALKEMLSSLLVSLHILSTRPLRPCRICHRPIVTLNKQTDGCTCNHEPDHLVKFLGLNYLLKSLGMLSKLKQGQ